VTKFGWSVTSCTQVGNSRYHKSIGQGNGSLSLIMAIGGGVPPQSVILPDLFDLLDGLIDCG
jgi:hypothetical protein